MIRRGLRADSLCRPASGGAGPLIPSPWQLASGTFGQLVRSAYLAMELTGWSVIVPLSFASLATGLVSSLGSPWGLFRHYWVLAKLLINLLATTLLLVHMRPITYMAGVVRKSAVMPGDLRGVRIQLVADAALAVVALLAATTLAVYKPRGLTRYGWRKQRAQRASSQR